MSTAFFELAGGVSGDMLLASLRHVGADFAPIERALAASPYPLTYRFEPVKVAGIEGLRAYVEFADGTRWHIDKVAPMLPTLPLSKPGQQKAERILRSLLEAEAKVHAIPLSEVHLHEIGSLDTIGDVLGVLFAVEQLELSSIYFTELPMGGPPRAIAHGTIAIPAPAALELAKGLTIRRRDSSRELSTPTGIAILREIGLQQNPALHLSKVGVGFGEGLSFTESCVRLWIGSADIAGEELSEVETNLDDLSPEIAATLPDRLIELGALDATLIPATMKKGRHGWRLWALVPRDRLDPFIAAVFRETGTFGLRVRSTTRISLERKILEVDTPYGKIPVKVGYLDGKPVAAKPELEACRQAARALNIPLKSVMLSVMQKVHEMGLA